MDRIAYETHYSLDAGFPLIFGTDIRSKEYKHDIYLHWHESIELIYCSDGSGKVLSGSDYIPMKAGDLVVVNSGNIHEIFSDSYCRFYYIDPDEPLYKPFQIEPNQRVYQGLVTDLRVSSMFETIISELTQKEDLFCRQAAQVEIVRLLLLLMREFGADTFPYVLRQEERRISVIKNAIRYIKEHFLEAIQIEDVCSHVGFSKYYFCRTFKEITGYTLIQYVNRLRCQHARNLIRSGQYNVGESAILSGFNNISYFTKAYKSCFDTLPSQSVNS